MSNTKQSRRSEEQMIRDLEARIANLKARAAEKKVKKDPARRHVTKAVKAVDAAMAETRDQALRKALDEARATLVACLGLSGIVVPQPRRARASAAAVDAQALLNYVRKHPGERGEQISAALGTDSKSMRPVMRKLIDDGLVATEGERRGTTYSAVK